MATKIKFETPFGVARYPHISEPDTKGKFADNKYKVKLVFPAGDPAAQAFVEKVKDAAKQLQGPKGLKMYMPFTIDEDENEIVFTTKTQFAPAVFDSRGKPVKGQKVGGGSVLRIAGVFVEFEKGITAQFNQVQVKELNGFGTCAFGAVEDGYEFDGSEGSSFAGTDTTEDEGGQNGSSALDI